MDVELEIRLKSALSSFIGYPCNAGTDFSDIIDSLNIHINNVGDPYTSSTYKANTKDVELSVLRWFADLWGIDNDNFWGVITNGGTESSLQGLYIARESACASGKPHIFLTSQDSHYSIFKIARLLQLNLHVIKSSDNGEIDYSDFENVVLQNSDKYIIVNVNVGTTMRGAIDSSRNIHRILQKHGICDSFCHADAALSGFYLPFIEKDLFFKAHINSMAISGHKFIGTPFPCGIFMMEKRFLKHVTNNIEYIGSTDCTISGSRNGHAPLFLKHAINNVGHDGFQNQIERCIAYAEYLVENIKGAWRNQNSITVVIPRPSDLIIQRWQLATEGSISHIVVMPHVTKSLLDAFLADLQKK